MFLFLQRKLEDITNCTEQVEKQCNGSYCSDNPLKVTILGAGWSHFFFRPLVDSSVFAEDLAIQLAKAPEVKVTFLVPENRCYETKKRDAAQHGVTIVEAKEQPGFDDPTDWLYFPPQDLTTDIVVGTGVKFGKIAQVFKEFHRCKDIYIACDPLEEHAILLEEKRILEKKIARHGKCYKNVGLSQMADLAVAPGPKMSDNVSASLRCHEKQVFKLTPGVLSQFSDIKHATTEQTKFRILILGGGNPDNIEREGLNTAAEAVAELNDKSYHLLFASAAEGEHKQFVKQFSQCGVSKSQLTIRSLPKSRKELKSLFCEVDLAIMPSSEWEFGMIGLAALSSGLPVLVHGDSGFGEALKVVTFGTSSIVDSEDASVWAKAIKRVRTTERKIRLQEATSLRSNYDEKYSWKEQCGALVQKMLTMVSGMIFFDAFYLFLNQQIQISINYLNYVSIVFLHAGNQGVCKTIEICYRLVLACLCTIIL